MSESDALNEQHAAAGSGASPLNKSDAWQRMHPLTPVLRGGLFVVVVIGIILSNLRERLLLFLFPWMLEDFDYVEISEDDLLGFIVVNELYFLGLLVLLVAAAIVILFAWLGWRRRSYRITDEQVELRQGVIFRSQRRAPLDRIQNVTLVRPFIARMFGLSKLMITGAGTSTAFELSYLSTPIAESLRAEILLLASGQSIQLRPLVVDSGADAAPSVLAASGKQSPVRRLRDNIDGIVHGQDQPLADDAKTIKVKPGKLILASFLDTPSLIITAGFIATIVLVIFWPWPDISRFVAFTLIVAFAGLFWATTVSPIFKSLRYSLRSSPNGLQQTSGLTTTSSDLIPPGRVQSIELSQPMLWRAFGFWRVKTTRFIAGDFSQRETNSWLLPLGDLATAQAAVTMLLGASADAASRNETQKNWSGVTQLLNGGALGPTPDDGFTRAPRRSRWLSPFAWKRSAFARDGNLVAFRSGFIARRVSVVLLQRAQGTAFKQGPAARVFRLGSVEVSIPNSYWSPAAYWVDVDDAYTLWCELSRQIETAIRNDRSHRWANSDSGANTSVVLPDAAAPASGSLTQTTSSIESENRANEREQ